jgi:hydrogenase maturation protease
MLKTLVLGLGNPLLGDDGVGWHVAEEVAKLTGDGRPQSGVPPAAEVDFHAGGGLSLMERLVGYDRLVLIDAMNLGRAPAGTVTSFSLEELGDPFAGHLASTHETNLQTALELGRSMGMKLPSEIFIVAIESPHIYEFSETLSPSVTKAVPIAVDEVLQRLKE